MTIAAGVVEGKAETVP